MKILLVKGMTLGLVAGLIASLFDSLYMLTPGMYVPISYPVLILVFNTCFWMALGSLSGFLLWLWLRKENVFYVTDNFYWVPFFLVPFALLYGFLGRLFIPLSPLITSAVPVFDYHLSFVWVFLVLLFLIIFRRRVTADKPHVISFIPELTVIMALFSFCSNVGTFQVIKNYIHYLLQGTEHDYLLMYKSGLRAFYTLGVVFLWALYLLVFFKMRLFRKNYYRIIGALFLLSFLSLGGLFTLNHNAFLKSTYPSPVPLQTSIAKKIPHVILIVLDTVRADRLSLYGPHGFTKNLEDIAQDSLVFENCIATSPWTIPSHGSLFTGLFPIEHGSHGDLKAERRFATLPPPRPLSEKFITLAEVFENNNYQTGAVISNHFALHPHFQLDQGFNIYDAARNSGDLYRLYPFHPLVHLFCYLTNIYPKYISSFRKADDISRKSFRLLDFFSPAPFFLFINYMDAHDPYRPPAPFDGYFVKTVFPWIKRLQQYYLRFTGQLDRKSWYDYLLSQYDGEIAYIDHHLGKLFKKLKQMNLYDSSLIIITSDHEKLFGEKGFYYHRTPMYEGVLKVPLIIKFPLSVRTGYEKGMISLADIYPTILSACELPQPDTISRRGLGSGFTPLVSEFYQYGIGEHRTLYEDTYKYTKYQYQRTPELYDLEKDPQESVNLAEQFPEITALMNETLDTWVNEHKPADDIYQAGKRQPLSQEVEEGLKALGYVD